VKIERVELLRSAASVTDLPRDPLPQLAMVGRSNVGKSSLINALVRRQVARTSAAPGKTRLINLFTVTLAPSGGGAATGLDRFYLVDLPGYGYARGGGDARAEFAALTRAYFECPPGGHGQGGRRGVPLGPTATLLLVDSRHPGLPQDVAAYNWLTAQGRPCAVIATKIDKLSRAELDRALRAWKTSLNTPVRPVSAATGEGLEDLWKLISRLLLPPAPPRNAETMAAS
jgi:GTP-binding protein